MKPERILAIDPGTRKIGVAVLEGKELLYYGVKTIRRPKTPREILEDVATLIKNLTAIYQPHILAIEKMFLVQRSESLLVVVAEEIKATAKKEGLSIYEYMPALVRKRICQRSKATKQETAGFIARRYPELGYLLNWIKFSGPRYYSYVFDAVAVGIICSKEVEKATPSNQGEMSLV
jgi:Holliday junction resolvasome RuvABC endonuclease subunit